MGECPRALWYPAGKNSPAGRQALGLGERFQARMVPERSGMIFATTEGMTTMKRRAKQAKQAVVAEVPRDEQGYEMVPCCCVDKFAWTRLQFAGICGHCGRYTCDWCSARVDHLSTPCVDCAKKEAK